MTEKVIFLFKKIIEMMKTLLRFGIEYETVEEHLPITTNNVNSSSVTTPSPSATIGVPRLFVRDILPGSIAQNGGEITDVFFLFNHKNVIFDAFFYLEMRF